MLKGKRSMPQAITSFMDIPFTSGAMPGAASGTLGHLIGWLSLFVFVSLAQHFAANEWERQLWRKGETGFSPYLKIGVLWGACGASLFSLGVIRAGDPDLFLWVSANGLILAHVAVAILAASAVAWTTVERSGCRFSRAVAVLLVSLLFTFDYPLLKWFQTGEWVWYPVHLFALALNVLSFSSIINLSTLTLGYSNLRLADRQAGWRALAAQPRVLYAAACLSLNVMWLLLQLVMIQSYPIELRSGVDGGILSPQAWARNDLVLAVLSVSFVLLTQGINSHARQRLLWVQDQLAWNTNNRVLPGSTSAALETTALVKKALGLSKGGVITWHAPNSSRNLGTRDLRSGVTFISSGLIHDAGLSAIADQVNLPDFWQAIMAPDDFSDASAGLERLMSGQMTELTGQWKFRSTSGAWLHVRGHLSIEISPINGLPMRLVGVYANVTEEVQENDLLGAAKVRQLNALRMIGHDLRGSLSTVLMSTALAERLLAKTPSEAIAKNLQRIRSASDRALELLSDTVTYARSEDISGMGEPKTIPLHNLLEEIVGRETARFHVDREKVVLEVPRASALRDVLPFPLTAALTNLISNAIKYTPDPAGKVRVSVRALGAKNPGISGCTMIEISDDGVGIPPAFLDRLFTAFSRADNVGMTEGFGLGLAIVSNAVEMLGAQINAISVPDRERGTSFTLILPNSLVILADTQAHEVPETAGAHRAPA